jgi:ribosomal protein S25
MTAAVFAVANKEAHDACAETQAPAVRLDVAFTTAQRAIERLESAGIVTLATGAKRNRVYCAQAILEILEEPPRLDTNRSARRRGRRT